MLGNGCDHQEGEVVRQILQVQSVGFIENLGLPVPLGCMKAGNFKTTLAKFLKRLLDWSEKYLSSGGKEVLIKSVMQTLPTLRNGGF